MSNGDRRHVFISHHHADDGEVTKLTGLLKRSDIDIRNSSIRAKPANQERLDKGLVSDKTIERILRMKISWASTVVVLIGQRTASRPWVNWEIEQANRQGKRIVGIYARGSTEADVPPSFQEYGSALVGWNTESIISAIDGGQNVFQKPDGTDRAPFARVTNIEC